MSNWLDIVFSIVGAAYPISFVWVVQYRHHRSFASVCRFAVLVFGLTYLAIGIIASGPTNDRWIMFKIYDRAAVAQQLSHPMLQVAAVIHFLLGDALTAFCVAWRADSIKLNPWFWKPMLPLVLLWMPIGVVLFVIVEIVHLNHTTTRKRPLRMSTSSRTLRST